MRKTWVLACGVAALLVACARTSDLPALPPGHHLYGTSAQVLPLLDALATLRGTPAARAAAQVRERIAACDHFLAQAERIAALLDDLHCADASPVPAAVGELPGNGALGFALQLGPARFLRGRVAIADSGGVEIEGTLEPSGDPGLASLLVPGDEPPGLPALDARRAIVHARVRPASGLDLASLVTRDSQADRMFHLRSKLFSGALLDGSWEAAIYMPAEERVTPPMALALDHSIRAGAQAAMRTFVSELEATWPVHHSDREIAGQPGACFYDLKLLPDLVPCYVVNERSIVVGWNPASVELALGAAAGEEAESSASDLGVEGGLVVHLDKLPEADRRLQQQLAATATGASLADLWDFLRLEASGQGERVAMRLSLRRAEGTP